MNSKDTKIGRVVELYANNRYKIQSDDGKEVQAYLAGKMRLHKIKVAVGDMVEFVVDSQGNNNRIIRRK